MAQEGMTTPSDDERNIPVWTGDGLSPVHSRSLAKFWGSISSPSQKHNPINYLEFSSYMVIIFIEIESQQDATA